MLNRDELLKHPNYLLTTYNLEIYKQLVTYMEENKLKKKDVANDLGFSRPYVSQILAGKFNFTLKKLIELGLYVGKVPYLEFIDPVEYWEKEEEKKSSITIDASAASDSDSFAEFDLLDTKGGVLLHDISNDKLVNPKQILIRA